MAAEDNENLPPIVPPAPALPPAVPAYGGFPTRPIPATALPHRPGILSAIGPLSIIVALLTLGANLMGGCQTALAYRIAREVKTIRSSPSMGAAAAATSSTQPAGNNPLTPAEVSTAIQRAQAAAGNKLSVAQTASLSAALADPKQQLITRGTNWSPVRLAAVNPDDSAYVYFSGGLVVLDAQGQITSTTINSTAIASINIPLSTCLVAGADGILNIFLAVMLFMGAISVMRNGRYGRRLHLLYACAKIPLVIAGGWAMATVSSDFWSSMIAQGTPGGGAEAGHQVFVVLAWAFCGGGLIYPIVLLIAMNTRGVRNFYRVVT